MGEFAVAGTDSEPDKRGAINAGGVEEWRDMVATGIGIGYVQ